MITSRGAGITLVAGRNLRSVWEFPTAQTPEAHFATFPEELPRRCIEASCPREICAKCGTAKTRRVQLGPLSGWQGCTCAEPDHQPGIVLDPFAGIGTSLLVARRLGRRYIGVELSEKYAAMAAEKLRVWWRKATLSEAAADEAQPRLLEVP